MQIMQSLLRQGKALQFYANCNWKPPRGFKPNFKYNLQSYKLWGMVWKGVRVEENRIIGRLLQDV